jgi:3-oxoacyl-[acyl-carrier-protein] synthase II
MADVILAGGAEAPLSPLTYGAFDFIKTMSRWEGDPPLACKPFDLNRDGFVMGEGAATLVIEEYEHALRRGARIYAEVLGYSLNNEAWHMTTPLPGGECVIACMREALADAKGAAGADWLHQCSRKWTPGERLEESSAVRRLWPGTCVPISRPSGTSLHRHPLGDRAIETVICALRFLRISAARLAHQPRSSCGSTWCQNRSVRPRSTRDEQRFGFGGITRARSRAW